MKYKSPESDRVLREVLDELSSDDQDIVCRALVDLVYVDTNDFGLILNILRDFSCYNNSCVAQVAIRCTGDLFRVYTTDKIKQLADETIKALVSLRNSRKDLEGAVDDAISDIEVFCRGNN